MLGVLVGCGGPKEYKPKPVAKVETTTVDALTPENVLPLKEGNRWVYAVTTQTQAGDKSVPEEGELAIEVDRIVEKEGGKLATMRILRDGREVDRQNWLVNAKGLYQTTGIVNGREIAFSPPQPLVLFPVKEGETFEWKGKGVCPDGFAGTVRAKNTVTGVMDVDTGLGRKSGVAVESSQDFTSSANKGGMAVTTWYAPNIGILRILQTTVVKRGTVQTTLRLTKSPA